MKAQCERCKEIVALDFTVEPGGAAIRVRCPACQADYTVAATTSTAPAAAPERAEMTCPKCGEPQKKAEACRRCGLIIARWTPESATAAPILGDVRDATAMWTELEATWDDAERHEAFISHCRRAGVLAFAAARYRLASGKPEVAARLAQIRVLAEQSLAAAPRTAPPAAKRSPTRTMLLALFMLALVAVGWLLLQSGMGAGR